MKKMGKKLCFIMVIFLLAAGPAFSDTITDLVNGVDTFSKELAKALPFNSTVGLNWSDAYIGQLLGLPPHFGVGIVAGATTLPIKALESITGLVGMDDLPLDIMGSIGFPLPALAAEARIGGIGIPFDIGIKYGVVPKSLLGKFVAVDNLPVEFDYQLVGADFRYALFSPKAFPIRVSVGVGFNYLRGGISANIGSPLSFTFTHSSENYTLDVSQPKVALLWETKTIELKAQVSFPLVIITPYAGVGASYGWSKAGYDISSTVKIKKGSTDQTGPAFDSAVNILGQYFNLPGVKSTGFGSMMEVTGFTMRAFGGISVNLFVIKIDLTAMYNIMDGSLGATVGVRFQL